MSEKFTVEIITPDSSILKTDASEVVIPSYEGDMGILKDHISLITFLRPGLIKIINESEKIFFVEEGTVEFSNNNLLILTSTVKNIENLDKNSIDTIIRKSEEQMNKDNITDKEKYSLAYKVDTLKEIN